MFLFIFQTWIVIGIAFLVFELFDGSTIFFLPLSLSSFVTSAYVFALENLFLPSILFFDQWYEILLFWALLGLLISLVLVRFWKRSKFDDSDINNYQRWMTRLFLTTVLPTVFVMFLITHQKHQNNKIHFKGL